MTLHYKRCVKKNTLTTWNVAHADDLFLEGYRIRNVNALTLTRTHTHKHTHRQTHTHYTHARTHTYARVCACTQTHRYTHYCTHTRTHTRVSWCFEPSQPQRITSGLTHARKSHHHNRQQPSAAQPGKKAVSRIGDYYFTAPGTGPRWEKARCPWNFLFRVGIRKMRMSAEERSEREGT